MLWIVFGLIAVTLYFAHSMTFELRASDNRVAGMEAEQAIEGARRYFTCVLSNVTEVGVLPDPQTYQNEAVPVGNAHFWVIGRGDEQANEPTQMHFGLTDEASKININIASSNLLINLPRMTPDIVANILTWRSTNTTTTSTGAESDTYERMTQPYTAKNAPFETVDELRLISEMDETTLYGEDANLNGVLDPNENDGDAAPPSDNMDGKLDPGLLEYCTVYTIEPTNFVSTNSSGVVTNMARINVANLATPGSADSTALRNLLTQDFGSSVAGQVIGRVGGQTMTSPLAFYYASQLTTAQFSQIEPALRGTNITGLINVNTASLAVLSCLWTNGQASQVFAYRQSNTNMAATQGQTSVWITQVLSQSDVLSVAPYLTGFGYQFTADIAALGHDGRGYRRTRFIYDTSQGTPIILHRQDLSHLGWALGKAVRDKYLLAKSTP